jgi:Ser-tRNA(Ala) deacylase AlaX
VIEVIDEGENIAHRLAAPVGLGEAACAIDWPRRFDHMQQHTGQHLLSAVFEEVLGFPTISFHLGQESSTIDLESSGINATQVREVELRANQVVFENREVSVGLPMPRKLPACESLPGARENCASLPSAGSTAAPAAARMCAPPARSAPS